MPPDRAVAAAARPPAQPPTQRPDRPVLLAPAGVAAALLGGALTAVLGPWVGVAVVACAALFVACAYRPVFATYCYLATVPIIAGVERGVPIPLVRPNEALFALLLAGAAAGGLLRFARGAPVRWRPHPLDIPLGLFVVMSTVWPIASLLLREHTVTFAELLAVFPTVKLAALAVLVRFTVTSQLRALRCVRLIVWPAAALALIAIGQTLQIGPVVSLLETWWPIEVDGEGALERGSSTLSSSIATGDYIIIALTLVICCGVRGLLHRRERLVLGLVLGAGVLAAGQFSTWIAAAIAVAMLAWRYPDLRRQAVRFLPLWLLAVAVGTPALVGRLQGFGEGFGVPRSWLGRWDNVMNIHLPHFDAVRVFMGVKPDSVLQAPETWRENVFLESGYLQFLWAGGIPLLLAFILLSVAVLRHASRLSAAPTVAGACASTLVIVWCVLLVLTVIDAHLTLRGAGDLTFVLLAIVSGRINDERR
jgi:hypothetical protein